MKYAIGDKVKIIRCDGDSYCRYVGSVKTITKRKNDGWALASINDSHWWQEGSEIIKVGDNGVETRRTFRLLKDTPWADKGALFQEACDDGDQEYRLVDNDNITTDDWFDYFQDSLGLSRKMVEMQPEWFEEVEMHWVAKAVRKINRIKRKK